MSVGLIAVFCPGAILARDRLKLSQLNHISWTARDGAPSEIYGLAQAPDGVLWIGAGAGLFQFDGIIFTPFQPQRGQAPLPGLTVSTLSIARNGAIWAGFKPSGVVSIRKGEIKVYGTGDGLPAAVPKQLLEGPDGTMWSVIEKHLFHLSHGHWQREPEDSIPAAERVYKAFFDRAGVQWVGTNARIYRRPVGSNRFEATLERGGLVWQFAESPKGELWIAVVDESLAHPTIRRLDVEGHHSVASAFIDLDSEGMLFDDTEMLWVAAERGVWTLQSSITSQPPTKGLLSHGVVSDRYDRSQGLTSDSTLSTIEDTSGDIWVGTIRGLDRFKQPKFIHPEGVHTTDDGMIISACKNGDVYLGVPQNPLVLIRNGQTLQQTLKNGQIYSLECGDSGNVYYTDEHGLGIFDGMKARLIGLPPASPPFSAKQVIEMPDRSLVVPLRNGAGFWRWTDNVWSRLPTPGMPTGTALVIYLDHEQRLWAGYAKDQIGRLANGIGSTLESTGVGDVTAFAETTHGFLAAGVNGVSIDYTAQILKVTCSDDGVGMDEETLRLFSKPGHWGLVG